MDERFLNGYEDIDPTMAEHRVYWDSCPEFEEFRKECLSEKDNWLLDNYTKENLIIEEHRGYAVSYRKDTGEPIVMAGVWSTGLWHHKVARMLNRMYIFPKFRRKGVYGLSLGWIHVNQHIIQPLIDENKYKLYLMTMQDRGRPNHNFFKGMVRSFQLTIPNWIEEDNMLVKSCHKDVKQCYQYFMYNEIEKGFYDNWTNKPIITKNDWEKLPLGK